MGIGLRIRTLGLCGVALVALVGCNGVGNVNLSNQSNGGHFSAHVGQTIAVNLAQSGAYGVVEITSRSFNLKRVASWHDRDGSHAIFDVVASPAAFQDAEIDGTPLSPAVVPPVWKAFVLTTP